MSRSSTDYWTTPMFLDLAGRDLRRWPITERGHDVSERGRVATPTRDARLAEHAFVIAQRGRLRAAHVFEPCEVCVRDFAERHAARSVLPLYALEVGRQSGVRACTRREERPNSELRSRLRCRGLEVWCAKQRPQIEPPHKTAVAQRLLSLARQGQTIVDPRSVKTLTALYGQIERVLD
jgi:hypothetical protein